MTKFITCRLFFLFSALLVFLICTAVGAIANTQVDIETKPESKPETKTTTNNEFKKNTDDDEPDFLLGAGPAFVTRPLDYSIEMGPMTSKDDLFWMGALLGVRTGNCVFLYSIFQTASCHQFIDVIAGAAVAEGETQGHFWLSARWQYLLGESRFSPFWRVGGGLASVARPSGRSVRGVGIGGVGVSNYLHDKVDAHVEARVVSLDKTYLQISVGLNFKIDKLFSFILLKLRDLGIGTVKTAIDVGGTAIKATGEGISGIATGVSAPFKKKDAEKANEKTSDQTESK